MGKKISELKMSQIPAGDIIDVVVTTDSSVNPVYHRITLHDLLYDFALDIWGHERTAKMKVELYLKSKSKK